MPGNAIEASFGLDLAPLKRDFSQAETIAKTGASRVQSAMANSARVNWNALSRQREQAAAFLNPRPRTARDFRPAPPGKYSMDEEGAGSARSLRGLGAGLTLVAGIHQLANWYSEANAAASELFAKTSALTRVTGSGAFRGVAEMESNFKEVLATIDQIQTRKIMETKRDDGGVMKAFGAVSRFFRQAATGESNDSEAGQVAKLRAQAVKTIGEMAEKQNELNKAESLTLAGEDRLAAILKAQIAHRERLGQLAAQEAAAGVRGTPLQNAENARFANELAGINKQFPGPEARRSVVPPHGSTPDAYLRHPDAYTNNPDVMGGRVRARSGLDWFREHPRDFGFNTQRTLLKSDEDAYYANSKGLRNGPLGLGAMGRSDIQNFGAGSFMDRATAPALGATPLSPADKHEGAKDLSALGPLLNQILTAIKDAWN